MVRTRLSLFYLAGYLIPAGLLLLLVPQPAMTLLFSSRAAEYGDIIPRMLGMVLIGLGIIVVQIIRLKLEALYFTTIIVRIFFVICISIFYVYSRDPFFISLVVIVGFGLLITSLSYRSDQSKAGLQKEN